MKNEKENIVKNNVFENYQINILLENNVIEAFEKPYTDKKFEYNGKKYNINNKYVYYIPIAEKDKTGYLPVLHYYEGNPNPINITNKNEGIPARALYLLWNHALYSVIVTFETDRTNKLIILILLINAIMFGIRLYFEHGSS